MPQKKEEEEPKPQLSAEEIVQKELDMEKRERGKAMRLLGLGPQGAAGAGALLILGLALLLYMLGASFCLAAILGGIGAIAGAIVVVTNPFKTGDRKHDDR